MTSHGFPEALEAARRSGRVLLDLAADDPARCGLWLEAEDLAAILEGRRTGPPETAVAQARDAVASYLAGHGATVAPGRVILVRSRHQALRLALEALLGVEGEVLVPAPARTPLEASDLRLRAYRLEFDGRWRLDRRSLRRALGRRTRAVLVGNPADPTGASLSPDELRFLDQLCCDLGLALVGDEAFLDATLEPSSSVATARRCLAVHASGLAGICGLPRLETEWLAVTGPEALAGPLAARLAGAAGPADGGRPGVASLPPLLARREEYLTQLRARLARNRAALASGSLREAPWTLQWGGGGWAVLQVNPAHDGEELCRRLLEEGVAALPGHLAGLPRQGTLVLSLLPRPEIFDAGLARIEAQLRLRVAAAAHA